MRRLLSLLALSAAIVQAQTPDIIDKIATLKATARLVTVDVAVTDSKGAGIPGLTCANFQLMDKKAPQTLRHCEDHTAVIADTTTPPPTLPPNVFTNANTTALPPTLDVFVFDFLNAGKQNQSVAKMRQAVRDLLAKPIPGHRVAVFAMGDRLQLVSGFSDDIARSAASISEKLNAAAPVFTGPGANLNADGSANTGPVSYIPSSAWDAIPTVDQQVSVMDQMQKLRITIEELQAITSFLTPLPGRKRLLWVAGSSPFNFGGDISIANASNEGDAWDLFKKLSNELIENRIQVFPIDVSGVLNTLYRDPAVNDDGGSGKGANEKLDMQLFANHNEVDVYRAKLDMIAADSGGKAYYGSNSLADLYKKALNYGNQFYTLTYTPNNFKPDGSFHEFKVTVAERKAKISYPRGYLVPDEKAVLALAKDTAEHEIAVGGAALPARSIAEKESAVAMLRGLPNPTSLLFTVRVIPPERTLIPITQKGSAIRTRGDLYGIDLSINTPDIGWTPKDDLQTASLKMRMVIYDQQNRVLGQSDVPANLHLNPQQFAKARAQGLQMHFDIPLRLPPGSHLRLGIEDIASHHIGTVEIETRSLQSIAKNAPTAPASQGKQQPAQP